MWCFGEPLVGYVQVLIRLPNSPSQELDKDLVILLKGHRVCLKELHSESDLRMGEISQNSVRALAELMASSRNEGK
jgi:hypothetical protein